jgi:ATP-dependent Clp protease ATP-binding subunit ClpA
MIEMFERFTEPAREAVAAAQEEASLLGHGYLGTEHLLLGILRARGVGARSLDVLSIGLEDARRDVDGEIGSGTPRMFGDTDADALRSIGIDLDEVRRRIEATFGAGALDRSVRTPRRGRESGPSIGRIPFTPRAKKTLQLALREARALGHGWIGTEHILLGLVRDPRAMAAEILERRGASATRVRGAVLAALGRERPGRSA